MTPAERLLWWKLRKEAQGRKFNRQTPIGPFVADFACIDVKLVIEVDGETHSTPEEVAYDRGRVLYLERNGWHVVRFWNAEVFQNLDGVVETIRDVAADREKWLAGKPSESP